MMLKLLQILLIGHAHRYVEVKQVRVFDTPVAKGLPKGTKYILSCKECGKMKIFKDWE